MEVHGTADAGRRRVRKSRIPPDLRWLRYFTQALEPARLQKCQSLQTSHKPFSLSTTTEDAPQPPRQRTCTTKKRTHLPVPYRRRSSHQPSTMRSCMARSYQPSPHTPASHASTPFLSTRDNAVHPLSVPTSAMDPWPQQASPSHSTHQPRFCESDHPSCLLSCSSADLWISSTVIGLPMMHQSSTEMLQLPPYLPSTQCLGFPIAMTWIPPSLHHTTTSGSASVAESSTASTHDVCYVATGRSSSHHAPEQFWEPTAFHEGPLPSTIACQRGLHLHVSPVVPHFCNSLSLQPNQRRTHQQQPVEQHQRTIVAKPPPSPLSYTGHLQPTSQTIDTSLEMHSVKAYG